MSKTTNLPSPKKSEFVSVNGKEIYYEKYGQGQPLFLLHGYTQSSVSWQSYVQDFVDENEVYLVDLTGHGRSEPFKEDLSIQSVAEDLQALIQYLQLPKITAIGFSFGGDVLYQLALLEPFLIESMVTIGAVGSWSILDFPHLLDTFTFDNRTNFPWLGTSHAGDEQTKGVLAQFKNYIVKLTDAELRSIKPEVLIIIGDDDQGMNLREIVRVRENLPASDLWILPDVAHGAHEGDHKEEFIEKVKRFFSKIK